MPPRRRTRAGAAPGPGAHLDVHPRPGGRQRAESGANALRCDRREVVARRRSRTIWRRSLRMFRLSRNEIRIRARIRSDPVFAMRFLTQHTRLFPCQAAPPRAPHCVPSAPPLPTPLRRLGARSVHLERQPVPAELVRLLGRADPNVDDPLDPSQRLLLSSTSDGGACPGPDVSVSPPPSRGVGASPSSGIGGRSAPGGDSGASAAKADGASAAAAQAATFSAEAARAAPRAFVSRRSTSTRASLPRG